MAIKTASRIVMPVPPKAVGLDPVAFTAAIVSQAGRPAAAVLGVPVTIEL